MKNFTAALFNCLLLIFSSSTLSYEYQYALESAVRFSDNIAGSANAESGRSINAGYYFRLNTPTYDDWFADVSGKFVFEEFYTETSQNQQYKQLTAFANYRPRTSNFSLRVLGDISQTPRNRFAIESIDNLRDTKSITLMPSYFYKFTGLDRLNLDYSYTDSINKDIENDAEIINGSRVINESTIEYERQLNSTQKLFITARNSETDFDALLSEGAVDDERNDLLLRWIVLGQATQLKLEYGMSEITDDLGNDIEIHPYQLSIERQFNRQHSLEFLASSGFDSEINERFSTDTLEVTNQSSNFTSAQKVDEIRVIYDRTSEDLNFSLEVFNMKIEDILETNTEEQKSYQLTFSYPISRYLMLKSNADLKISLLNTKSDFNTVLSDVSDRELKLASLLYTQYFTQAIAMTIRLDARREDSIAIQSITAKSNSISFGIRYSPLGWF